MATDFDNAMADAELELVNEACVELGLDDQVVAGQLIRDQAAERVRRETGRSPDCRWAGSGSGA
jgi:hypothetical protein